MGEIAVLETKDLLSQGDLAVLRNSKFKGFTDDEISYARSVCSHLQLNPILRQIHFVKRKDHSDGTYTVTVQVGIDGFRLAVERMGRYVGRDDGIFKYKPKTHTPIKANVTVYKIVDGIRVPYTASARWEEYYPGDQAKEGFMWRKMPHGQLAKCAEALALRKAFPQELSALRTDEEMAQAARPVTPITSKAKSLNARGTLQSKEAQIVDAEVIEATVTPAKPQSTPPKEDFGEYVCQVGKKFRGRKLKEISLEELVSFLAWIRELDDASPSLLAFATKAEAFMGNGIDINQNMSVAL
ncbi:MAG: phage recombination protein Bet [Bdellovibrionales bacterium]|nr:phage recombination protein Bet [Bdellovibrionales bacterium]